LLKNIKDTDFVVIDSYLADKLLYDRISKMTNGRLLMVDDYNRIEYPKGVVVNPSIYGDKLSYSKKAGTIYLLGQDYITLRKEFKNVPEKIINKKVNNILITFGGMDHSDLIYRITEYLKDRFSFNVFVAQPKNGICDTGRMINLMLDADICISGCGQTTYELAKIGVPTLGVCFAKNQINNLNGWQEKGFIEYIGWHNDAKLPGKLKKALENLTSYEERIRRSKIGRVVVDGKGAERILKKLVKNSELR